MAAGNQLNYLIAVQMSENKALKDLLETLRAIQALSRDGADFKVTINQESLSGITRSVSDAVEAGISRGGRTKVVDSREANNASAGLQQSVMQLQATVGSLAAMMNRGDKPAAGRSASRVPGPAVSATENKAEFWQGIVALLESSDPNAPREAAKRIQRAVANNKVKWKEFTEAANRLAEAEKADDPSLRQSAMAEGQKLLSPASLKRLAERRIKRIQDSVDRAVEQSFSGDVTVTPTVAGTRITVDVASMQGVFDNFIKELRGVMAQRAGVGGTGTSVSKAYSVKPDQQAQAEAAIEGGPILEMQRQRDRFARQAEQLRARITVQQGSQKANTEARIAAFEARAKNLDDEIAKLDNQRAASPLSSARMSALADAARADNTSVEAFTYRKIGRTLDSQSDAARNQAIELAVRGIQAVSSTLDIGLTKAGSRAIAPLEVQSSSLESRIAGLRAAAANPTISEAERARAQEERIRSEEELATVRREIQALRFADVNSQIRRGAASLQSTYGLAGNTGAAKAIEAQEREIAQAVENDPNLRRQTLLIPQAVGEYVTKVFRRYTTMLEGMTQGGQLDTALLAEINKNPLLSGIIKPSPADSLELGVTPDVLANAQQRFRQFSGATLASRYARDTVRTGLPTVNPIVARDASGIDFDTGVAQIQEFLSTGGSFALQTQERRKFAINRSQQLDSLIRDAASRKDEFEVERFEKEREELLREIEFGGRYIVPGTASARGVMSGRLVSPGERRGFRSGGAISDPIRAQAFDFSKQIQEQAQATNTLGAAVGAADKQLDQLNAGIKALTDANLNPVIDQFTKIAAAFQPIAASLGVLAGTSGGRRLQSGAISAATARARERALQEERLAGQAARAAERENRAQLRASQEAIARARAQLSAFDISQATVIGGPEGDPSQLPAALALTRRTFQRLAQSQTRQRDIAVDAEALAFGGQNNSALLAAGRRESSRYFGVAGQLAGQIVATDALRPGVYGQAGLSAAQNYLSAANQINPARRAIVELLSVREELAELEKVRGVSAGQNRSALEAGGLARAAQQRLEAFSTNTGAFFAAQRELPRLLNEEAKARNAYEALQKGNATPDQLEAGRASLESASRRANFGRRNYQNLGRRILQDMGSDQPVEALNADVIGAFRERLQADAGNRQADVNAMFGTSNRTRQRELFREREARVAEIDREIQQSNQRRLQLETRLAAVANGRDVRDATELVKLQRELNKELRTRADLMIQATQAQILQTAETRKTSTFFDEFVNKARNLTEYVLAGGIVYTLASSIRNQITQAVEIESEIARLRGIYEDRSASTAQQVATGFTQASSDFGVPLLQAIQSGRAFAQTGASSLRTVELTRASLAAQVGAGLESGAATEFLIAADNVTGGRVAPFEILDRISRIESQYAVSAQDLSEAVQRAGSLAVQLQPQQLGGVDALDTVIGAATAIIESTRVSGNQAATALRFLISRLTAPEVGRQLQGRFGINLAGEDPNTLRPLQDIFSDIADEYKRLQGSGQTVQAQELLVAFAGARQTNTAAALLTNFNKAMEVASESAFAYGDTQARVNLQLDTVQAQYQRFQTALTGFTYQLLEGSGVGEVIKLALRGGTAALNASSNPLGLALGGVAAARLGSAASNFGANRLIRAGLVDADGAPLRGQALRSAALAGGVSGTANIGAGLLAGGSALGFLGTSAAIIGAVEVLGRAASTIERNLDIRNQDVFGRSTNGFDFNEFRKSPLFQSFTARAESFGFSTDDFTKVLRTAADTVVGDIEREGRFGPRPFALQPGDAAQPGLYAEATKRLVAELDKALPGFAALGDESFRTAEALNILKESSKFTLALPQSAIAEFTKDLGDYTNEVGSRLVNLSEALRNSASGLVPFKGGLRPQENQGTALSRSIEGALQSALSIRGRFLFDESGTSVQSLRFAGQSISNIVGEARGLDGLRKLDEFARANLLVTGKLESQLRSAEASLRLKGEQVTLEARYNEALKGLTKATDDQKKSLSDANVRLGNQDALAKQFESGIRNYLNTGNRIEQVGVDLGNTDQLSTPGAVFTTVIRQAFERARQNLLREFSTDANNQAANQGTIRLLRGLQTPLSRPETAANLYNRALAGPQIRERLLEPFINYSVRSREIQTQNDLRARFGIYFDRIQEQSSAAQQFVTDVSVQPTRILGDLARAQVQYLLNSGSGGNIDELIRAANPEDNEGNARIILPSSEIRRLADNATGTAQARNNALTRLGVLREQYKIATEQGIGGFLTEAERNPATANVAKGLRESLDTLLTGLDSIKPDDIQRFFQLTGGIEKLIEEVRRVAQAPIFDAIARAGRLNAVQQNLAGSTARLSAQGALEQVQLRLAGDTAQAFGDPSTALQFRLRELQRQRGQAVAEANLRLQAAERTFRERGIDTAETRFELENARSDRLRALGTAGAAERTARLEALGQANLENVRERRQEASQLANDVIISPLREFFSTSNNLSAQGLGGLARGVGAGAQGRLTDIFLNRIFSETGLLGNTINAAFNNGALTTQTAIQRGFALGVQDMLASLGISAGSAGIPGVGGALGGAEVPSGGAVVPNGGVIPMTVGGAAAAASGKFQFKGRYGELLNSSLPLAGSLLGGVLGTTVGGSQNTFANEGAAIGSLVGTATPLGPIGGAIGGVLGGLIGGLIKGGDEEANNQTEALQKIERNTREQIQAIQNQTQLLVLDSRFVNVPAGFTVPQFRPFGVGGGAGDGRGIVQQNTIEFNITAAKGEDAEVIAQQVSSALRRELGRIGGSFDVRNS